jgi:hypothetical protein
MNKLKHNQAGFSAVEIILVIALVAALGAIGWLVYKNQKKPATTTTTTVSTKSATAPAPAAKTEVDPTAGWTAYSSKTGEFNLKYPSSWVQASNKSMCSDDLLLLGANAASVGRCASDGGGQILITSAKGNVLTNYELDSSSYPDLKTEAVTINGVTGKKQSGTFKAPPEGMGIGPSDGDKTVAYTFYTNGHTYYASNSIKSTYPDVLNDFNLIVTKTLKFTP